MNTYQKMVSKGALKEAHLYLAEEYKILENFLKTYSQIRNMNVCVVGGGNFHYLSLILQFAKSYTLIEPSSNKFKHSLKLSNSNMLSNVLYFQGTFEKYCQTDLPKSFKENTIYIFWFNVIYYIENPIDLLNKIIKNGDVIFISGWGETNQSYKILKSYFKYINSDNFKIHLPMLPTLEALNLEQLNNVASIDWIKQDITDIRIIHTKL